MTFVSSGGVAYLFLVRSMRTVFSAAALILFGCVSQSPVTGPYASRLSGSDVRQITALVTPRSKNVHTEIEAIRPDKVRVTSKDYVMHNGTRTLSSTAYIFTATRDWTGSWHPGEAEIVRP